MEIVHPIIPLRYRELTWEILGACIDVHRVLGPGLLESAYCECLEIELRSRRLSFLREVPVDIDYKGHSITNAFRSDFLIEKCVILEAKAVAALEKLHEAQLLTYLKLSGIEVGLLVNFNAPSLRQGIRRMVRTGTKTHPSPELRVNS